MGYLTTHHCLFNSQKLRTKFKFCDIWCKHKGFSKTIDSVLPKSRASYKMSQIWSYLTQVRPLLSKLNRDHYADLCAQQDIVRRLLQKEKVTRARYIDILSSSIALIQQQSKIEWIKYEDDSTRLFVAKAKQRKLASYIYIIKDVKGNLVEGFHQVRHLIFSFYKEFIGEIVDSKEIYMHITGLQECSFPLKCLAVPITASRLTKIDCKNLVEKIFTQATRSISFACRLMLISSVVFGMFNYWASIFLLPIEVVDRITQICRNYSCSGTDEFKKNSSCILAAHLPT
ncbi:hypothetical protein Cgig2_013321 [Carnegiea gigantea]|uniref:Uncharacterized protein n=1 Tax=Carnegiea gigantea TaxID=171969 RepID=A0A9Q1JEX7_9CARY|nr:hypothetical protein Cgig2_013321 [Carnegiea gigantea]